MSWFKRGGCAGMDLTAMLKGIVEISMQVVDVANLVSGIRRAAVEINGQVHGLASASEEMNSTTRSIAENATHASQRATQVQGEVDEAVMMMGRLESEMDKTNHSMASLRTASEEISQIVETIASIAAQTNLLALNAAIEAARAGDAGRGFAVVADEVRKLSQQSQAASQQIAETIQRINGDIENVLKGVEGARQAVGDGTQKVRQLTTSAGEILDLMHGIAHATSEQAIASQSVADGIREVSAQATRNEQQTGTIMDGLDTLCNVVEHQRGLLAEADIAEKVVYLAQADHALWKKKIVDFSMQRIKLDPAQAGDHKLCRLGKWYYSTGMNKYGSDADFKAMEASHRDVHASAKEAAERRARDPNANIDDLVARLEHASVDVVARLKKLVA
ncbi:MAG: CZB domain-containing protein [Pseudomonadaceae bacterium]|nr:CZB domain-containing protein [Pseudomonadaceae bacterium]